MGIAFVCKLLEGGDTTRRSELGRQLAPPVMEVEVSPEW
jgi:hypothetical protein